MSEHDALDVLVVGGGIAGATCAARCASAGLSVEVVDRGRRVGGRMATRALRDPPPAVTADTAVASFAIEGADFRAEADRWTASGVVRWLPNEGAQPVRAAGVAGARAVVEHVLGEVAITVDRAVEALDGLGRWPERPARGTVLAMPGPQARRLLGALPHLAAIADQSFAPALTLTTRWPRRSWLPVAVRDIEAVPALDRLVDDGFARGDDSPVLVARCTAAFAAAHLDRPSDAVPAMLDALRTEVGTTGYPLATHVQRWTYAQPATARQTTHFLSPELVGLCGDGWSRGGGVEGAWRSGRDLADSLIASLAG